MRLSALALTLFTYASLAGAQELPDRVGRLSLTEGTVSIYQDPEIGWEEAFVNTPLTSENSVWTERGARAEVASGRRMARTSQALRSRIDDIGDRNLIAIAGTPIVRPIGLSSTPWRPS